VRRWGRIDHNADLARAGRPAVARLIGLACQITAGAFLAAVGPSIPRQARAARQRQEYPAFRPQAPPGRAYTNRLCLIAPAPLRRCLSGDLKWDSVRNVPTKLPAARVPPNPTANERFATPLGQPGGHFHPCGAEPICGRQLGRDSGRGRKGGAPRKGCHGDRCRW
jgi:hypothetical protein